MMPANASPGQTGFQPLDQAVSAAFQAFPALRRAAPDRRAAPLRGIAEHLAALGPRWLDVAGEESALGGERLAGERGRTVAQLRMFADLIEDGSWVEARIDRAQPARQPAAKPDLRRMLIPLGPVAVFGASNFPLAFSAAGGDTASALACGCPVVFRGHPAHPRTTALACGAIGAALRDTGLPPGCFVQAPGTSHDDAIALAVHPGIRALAFTGSFRGGRALFDAAHSRPEPIPVYAEMGSLNPLVLLPSALERGPESLADAVFASMTLGAGQFCTKPGLVLAFAGPALDRFVARLEARVAASPEMRMVYDGLCQGFAATVGRLSSRPGVSCTPGGSPTSLAAVRPRVLRASAGTFLSDPVLQEEAFGPATLVVGAADEVELRSAVEALGGQLTATIHGSNEDLRSRADLVDELQQRAGRLIVNGYPTGVEVCPSMHHGGPYPATTDVRSTSVGTAAIRRFVRPLCYQNVPEAMLPPELQDGNPLRIWRVVDGEWTRAAAV